MRQHDLLYVVFLKIRYSLLHALRRGADQVAAANDGVDFFAASQLVYIFQGIDHASVGATQHDDDSFRDAEDQRLIIHNLILDFATQASDTSRQ